MLTLVPYFLIRLSPKNSNGMFSPVLDQWTTPVTKQLAVRRRYPILLLRLLLCIYSLLCGDAQIVGHKKDYAFVATARHIFSKYSKLLTVYIKLGRFNFLLECLVDFNIQIDQ